MTFSRIATLSLAVLLGACSSTQEPSVAVTKAKTVAKLHDFKQTATLQVRWQNGIGDAGNNVLQPAVVGEAVFAANAKGTLVRLQAGSGQQLWQIDSGLAISAGVGAGEGLVLIGGKKGEVAAYAEDGKLRWQSKVSSEVLSAPQVANGIVVVRTGDGRITGLSAADGARQWLYERATPALIVRSHAGVTIRRGVVYAGFAGGKLAAIGLKNGVVAWETTVSQPRGNTELERISDITSLPVADDEQVCAVAFQGRLACFDIAQGSLLWSRDLPSDRGMVLQGKYIYLTDADGIVSALDKSSGSALWKNDQLTLRQTTTPMVLGNYVAVGDYEGYLHLLNREDGALVARLKTDEGAIRIAPLELDGGLLLQTTAGGLYSALPR